MNLLTSSGTLLAEYLVVSIGAGCIVASFAALN